MGETTITVDGGTLRRFNELKDELSTVTDSGKVRGPSSDEMLAALLSLWDEMDVQVDILASGELVFRSVSHPKIPNGEYDGEANDDNDAVMSSLETIESRTGSIEQIVESLAEGRR